MATPIPTVTSLLQANLYDVFAQRDPAARLAAISNLFVANPVFYKQSATPNGHLAISERVQRLLDQAPKNWLFYTGGEMKQCQDLGMMRWRFGPPWKEGEKWDVGRIVKLWTIIEGET